MSDGAKFDQGKAPIYRGFFNYFPRAIEAVSRVSEYGASIHGWDTWDTIHDPLIRYADAQMRHALNQSLGEFFDQESKLHHKAHEAWNALAQLEIMLKDAEA